MYGPILSVLLMGLVPVWGLQSGPAGSPPEIRIAPPVDRGTDDMLLKTLRNRLSASGVLIADLESGQALYVRDADVPRPMASLTKLMTALIIVENHDLNDLVTIPEDIADVSGNAVNLPSGDQYTVGDLLSALLIMSANDAAVTLSRHHSGSLSAFADAMNERARALGLRSTIFTNPTGLDSAVQQSSPRDLAWLAMFALRYPAIVQRMSMRGAQIRSRGGKVIYLTHTHALLHAQTTEDKSPPPADALVVHTSDVPAMEAGPPNAAIVRAGKTGTTDAAGQCLLSIVEAAGRRYVVVLLRSLDRYGDMRVILDTLTQ